MLPLGMPLFPKAVTIVVDQAPELRAVALGSADMYVAENLPAAGLGQLPRLGRAPRVR